VVSDEITTLLGKGSVFEGKLQFDGVVRIDGSYKGEIRSEGTLVLGPSAEVEAEVEVRVCVIEGNFSGNLRAAESVEIHAPAKVKGTVTTPEIQVERGVLLDGKCTMEEASTNAPPHAKGSGRSDESTGKGGAAKQNDQAPEAERASSVEDKDTGKKEKKSSSRGSAKKS
jgi:cytoskeletal protein CcmA (bactofilin family)